jgi:hypothetical protein
VVTRDGQRVATVAGAVTSYRNVGLTPASNYRYQVAAVWGAAHSALTAPLDVRTLASDAPLQGAFTVQYDMLSTPGPAAGGRVGERWNDGWQFAPSCAADTCEVRAVGGFSPPEFSNLQLELTLTRSGNTYTGTAVAEVTRCGPAPGEPVRNEVSVTVDGPASDLWTAWSGTMVVTSPYTRDGSSYYCPYQSWILRLDATTGGGQNLPPPSHLPSLMATAGHRPRTIA